MQLIDIYAKFVQRVLPQQCVLCSRLSGKRALCEGCLRELPYHPARCCPVCATPMPQAELCGACLKHPPHFDAATAVFSYAPPVDALLQAYKYGNHLAIAGALGECLALHVAARPKPDVILAMPLHPQRLYERGFNQAMEIARSVSRASGIPLALDTVVRLRPTVPQASLPLTQRRRNVRGAFACLRDLEGRHVAVVDDVMTSGATLNELAKVLKRAGAGRVDCWVMARTLREPAS
ncbi:MAG: ComF family protein [Methylophilaceae bacterium]|nr:ComF family protein [Methylophilaceae bacterium]